MFKKNFESSESNPPDIKLEQISDEGRLRLLDMAYSRLKFGLYSMPLVSAIFAIYFKLHDDNWYAVVWSLMYFCMAAATFLINQIYKKDQTKYSAAHVLKKWLPRIQTMAILHGIGLMIFLPIIGNSVGLEFKYLYILTVAAIMAANATHQAPMICIFKHFLFFGWHLTVLLMPWTLPTTWYFAMPLSVSYSLGMYRHALISHRFYVRMVWLEEESLRLANSYKLAKEAAENALNSKNQFLTTASHDLRQPLHAMVFLIESISHRNQDSSLNASLLDLKQSVKTLTQMFDSLLNLSKIELNTSFLKVEMISVDDLIEDIATLFREEANSKNLQFRIKHHKNQAFVSADAMLLRQSIVNLMHNALRYTPHGGILIAVRKKGTFWQIEVWDTGIGVALEDQKRVYSPFFRHQHAWRIDSAGHGLGLAVVARCAELMGADYGLTSTEGRGSRFWLRLPITQYATPDIVKTNFQHTDHLAALPTSFTGNCLVVDDDPQVCLAWETLLRSWHINCKCVSSASEAFNILNLGFEPNIIFCDQRLRAGEDGVEVLRALLDKCPNSHGAMVSGEFNSPQLQQAEDDGYVVLHKPLDVNVLHHLLSLWLPHQQETKINNCLHKKTEA